MFPRLAEIPTPWGGLPIYTHGVCLALAMLAAWYLVVHPSRVGSAGSSSEEGPARELDRATRGRVVLASALAGLFMGKLARTAATDGVLFEGGVEALGFLVGGGLASWAMLRDTLRALPTALESVARRFASAGLLVAAAIALGEYFGGARFGVRRGAGGLSLGVYPRWPSPTSDPTHALGAPAWRAQVDGGLIEATATSSLPTLPIPLFDAAIAATLAAVAYRFPRAAGYSLGLYALGRLALDRFRDPPSISDAAAAALVFALGLALARALRSSAPPEPLPTPSDPEP